MTEEWEFEFWNCHEFYFSMSSRPFLVPAQPSSFPRSKVVEASSYLFTCN
jgi:hypothetical protein